METELDRRSKISKKHCQRLNEPKALSTLTPSTQGKAMIEIAFFVLNTLYETDSIFGLIPKSLYTVSFRLFCYCLSAFRGAFFV